MVVLERIAEVLEPKLLEIGLAALQRTGALGLAADVEVGLDAEIVDVEVLDDLLRLVDERLHAAEEKPLAHLCAVDVRAASDIAEVHRGEPDHVGDNLPAAFVLRLHAPEVLRAKLEELRAHRGGFLLVEDLDERLREVGRLGELGEESGKRAVRGPRERLPRLFLGLVALVQILRVVVEDGEVESVIPGLPLCLCVRLQLLILVVQRRPRRFHATRSRSNARSPTRRLKPPAPTQTPTLTRSSPSRLRESTTGSLAPRLPPAPPV